MDDVLQGVRKIREAHAEQFGFDIAAIFRDVREQERRSSRPILSPPPRRIVPVVDVPVMEGTSAQSGSGQAFPPIQSS